MYISKEIKIFVMPEFGKQNFLYIDARLISGYIDNSVMYRENKSPHFIRKSFVYSRIYFQFRYCLRYYCVEYTYIISRGGDERAI